MEKQRLTWLLEQHLAATATAQEQQELSAIVKADTDRELFKTVLEAMMQQETPAFPANPQVWQKMVQDIAGIDRSSAAPVEISRARTFRLYRWTAAAAILLLISTGIYFFSNRGRQPALAATEKTMPALAITPVNNNVLTLSDGSQILLDEVKNGPIAMQGHTIITKQDKQITYTSTDPADDAGYHVISTARGSEYEVVLTDGSHIWLNAASSIRFPTFFSGAERIVDLSGQAWFDVQHADKMPFLVHSGALTTSVLGTAFDIKYYPGEKNSVVSVQRGKVKVQAGAKILAVLEKGQQVQISTDTTIHQQPIDAVAIAGWKQGELIYNDETLEAIVADLQRVFKDSVVIKNTAIKDVMARASFNKRIGMQQALELICNVVNGHLTKKDGIFIIE
jgi:ferric-dicitrate binding protein FerR (iron transport regulator)